jgi:ribosomal protein L24
MYRNTAFLLLILIFTAIGTAVAGQTPTAAVKPSVIAGDVLSLGEKTAVVTTNTGAVNVVFTDQTVFKRVSAVNPDFTSATDGAVTDIGVGDKLTVTGFLATDGKSIPARTVYFITKADIASKNAKESEEWRRRGVAGKVTNVNPQTGQLTIEVRGVIGSTNTVLTPKEGAQFLKYAPDSIRFDEAVASSLAEVNVGDMLRALGDKSADGTSFAAERVITGAFQTIAGTVTSVDTEKNEIVIKNLQDNKNMTVAISDFTVIKRFPQEMAERLAGAQMMAGAGGGARPAGRGNVQVRPVLPPGGQPAPGAGGRPGFGGAGGSGSIDDMIDRFPAISASELTVGDMIAFSSSKNGNALRVKAIKVLAGVEPFIRMAQASSGGRRGQGVDGGFTIPGLDSIGGP